MTPDPPAGLSNYWFRMHGCTKPKVILLLFMCRDQRQSRSWKKPSQTPVKMFNDTKLQRQKNNSCTVQELQQATAMKAQQYKGPTFLVFCPFWMQMRVLLKMTFFYTPSNLWQLSFKYHWRHMSESREEEGDIDKNKRYTNYIKICHSYQQFRTVREIYTDTGNMYQHLQ